MDNLLHENSMGDASNVLDADGIKLEDGAIAWPLLGKYSNAHCIVTNIGESLVDVRHIDGSASSYSPNYLTQTKPVFAKDSERVLPNETVWDEDGEMLTVLEVNPAVRIYSVKAKRADGESEWYFHGSLTHREPDSLEKLRDFASEWPHSDNLSNSAAGDFRDAMQEVTDRLTALIERGA